MLIFKYIIHVHFYELNKICNINADLDASDHFISGNEPSSEMLTGQNKKTEWATTGNA